jgi:hypothetical protein
MAKLTKEMTIEGILQMAKDAGVENNALFRKTLERYITLQDILDQLEQSMEEEGLLVTKEYVKGRKNLYQSPSLREYPRILDCANKTAATLMRIVKNASEGGGKKGEKEDDLMAAINGGEEYD